MNSIFDIFVIGLHVLHYRLQYILIQSNFLLWNTILDSLSHHHFYCFSFIAWVFLYVNYPIQTAKCRRLVVININIMNSCKAALKLCAEIINYNNKLYFFYSASQFHLINLINMMKLSFCLASESHGLFKIMKFQEYFLSDGVFHQTRFKCLISLISLVFTLISQHKQTLEV